MSTPYFSTSFFFVVLIAAFLWVRRGIDWFVLATALFNIFFSFLMVCLNGGILASAGVVFLGWGGGPIYLLLLEKKKKWATPVLLLFLTTLFAEVALQPNLRPNMYWTAYEAMLIFASFFGIISLVVFFMLRYSISQNRKIKIAEKAYLCEEAANKTRYYTDITHEFRTPLTIILGMADQISASPGDHLRSSLRLIRQNANRLLRLVNQMLDLSRLEAGAMPAHPVCGDIIPQIDVIIEPYQRMAEKKQCQIRFTSHPHHLELDFDPEKLESILGNLLSNAIRHSPPGSFIEISIVEGAGGGATDKSWFSVFSREISGRWWSLRVKDNGTGISPDEIGHIFDLFYQAPSGGSSNGEGTGVGLALVKELVNFSRGNLLVKSAPGKGTEFRLYFPLTHIENLVLPPSRCPSAIAPQEFPLEERTSIATQVKSPNILVVEDNPGVVHYLQSILEQEYRVEVASDGLEGINRAREWLPDLIISDVIMPVKDGYELCRTIKEDFCTSHIPIILLSARADRDSVMTGLEKGADAYLVKPFTSEELRTRIRKLIESREGLREKYRLISLMNLPWRTLANQDETFLKKLMDVLEIHLQEEDFHAGELANLMVMGRVQLFRKLKALTGHSASEVIQTVRLHKARSLLVTTKMRISEIAYQVGIKDPAYFSRIFTKAFGKTPSAMRKEGEGIPGPRMEWN